jgi:hypothetical protein
MNRLKKLLILSAFSIFLSCGIEEYYYLPQVPESYISSSLADSAIIILPSISDYYYATNYSIFYKIYISGEPLSSVQESNMNSINSELSRDYNSFSRYTDPTGTAVTGLSTFESYKYYEIELEGQNIEDIFTIYGGTLAISFQFSITGSTPSVSLNGSGEINLLRSRHLITPLPDRYFRNTSDLNANENARAENNADVAAGRSEITQRYTYVSMYIVAKGYNSEIFSPIYSKPTHINVFRLPETN